jgi:hypothetical protein
LFKRPAGAFPMSTQPRNDLQTEIAAAAARLIADEGLDYASAKRKAAEEVLGDAGHRRALPDNATVEHELRRHLETFEGETHRPRLAAWRRFALDLMRKLADFNPHLVGAVLNGTATDHSDLHLHLYTDDPKDVLLFLLNAGIEVESAEPGQRRGEPGAPSEELHFVLPAHDPALPRRVGVVLSVHDRDAIRVAARHRSSAPDLHPTEAAGRANEAALSALLQAMEADR